MRGNVLTVDDVSSCDPIMTMGDLNSTKNLNGDSLNSADVANPCGLIAKYFFNDEFSLSQHNNPIAIDETNIAHAVDRDFKFQIPEIEGREDDMDAYKDVMWRDVTNEHLMVWYQMETFPNFIKLWGHIDTELVEGEKYNITITNVFDVSEFDGKKFVYLSEVNDFGGTSMFMAYTYLGFAGVMVFTMIVFSVMYCIRIKNVDLYSVENLEW